MPYNRRQLIPLLIAWSCLSLPLSAQQHYRFKHITTKDGLSTNEIECIFQDSRGFIWAGTRDGLNRYDGHSFKVYKQNDWDILDLSTEEMAAIQEDTSGKLWIFTWGGLSRFDPETETFQRFTSPAFHEIESAFELKKPLLIDSRNQLWVAGRLGALRMDIATGEIEVFKEKKDSPYAKWTSGMAEDRHGNIWMAAGSGWKRFDPRREEWDYFLRDTTVGTCGVYYTDFLIDSDNNLWAFCPGEGFVSYNIDTRKRTVYSPGLAKHVLNPQTEIIHIYEDGQKRLWISTFWGLYVFDRRSEQFSHYKHDPKDAYSLSSSNVHYSMFDDKGRLWVGTTGGGLNVWDPLFSDFEYYQHLPDEPNSLSRSTATSAFEEGDTGLWIGTWGGGLNYYDRRSGRYSHYHPGARSPYQLPGLNIMYMHQEEGKLVVETYPEVVALDPVSRKFELHTVETTVGNLPEIEISDIGNYPFKDSRGRIYAATWGGDVKVYDPATGESVYLTENPSNKWPYYTKVVTSVIEDADGKIWVSTQRGGVYRYDPVAGDVKRFLHYPEGQPHLVNNTVVGLQKDAKGNIWAATKHQICRFDRKTQTFKTLQLSDEFPVINYRGFSKGASGKFYLGTWNGLYVFHPDSIRENLEVPPVHITGFLLNNHTVPVRGTPADSAGRSPLEKAILFTDSMQLRHWQNAMTFEFTALNYTQPERNQYRYKLEGHDEDWVTTTARRPFATYTNLAPGTYTFRVIASNNDGLWNEEGDRLVLTILPPWWQTWWAYTLYIALIAGTLYTFYRFQLNRRLAQAEAVRLREMDIIKTRLYTNITHELRTPLTVISGMADQVLNQPEDWFREGLTMIKRNSGQLLHLVNQLLDLSRLESGTLPLHFLQDDIIHYLKYLTESFHSYAETKGIRLHFQPEVERLEMDFDPKRIETIFANLVGNAVKFTPPGGEIHIHVRQAWDAERQPCCQLLIADNGPGIPQDKLPSIFDRFYQADDSATRQAEGTGIGLALTKELVKLLEGRIDVKSEVGIGTEFTVWLPVKREAPKQAATAAMEPVLPVLAPFGPSASTGSYDPAADDELPLALLVEDNADVLQYLAGCLRGQYRLAMAFNGQQGIEKALELVPDIIISDVMMPGKDGFEVCRTLKNDDRTSHIPIILLTAKADIDSRIAGLEYGADAYLAKPFHKQELEVQLRKLIELRRVLQARYSALTPPAPASTPALKKEDAFLCRLRQVVEEHLPEEDFGIPELCRALGTSRTQLHRKLTALTNKSTSHVIRAIRLQKARELLQTTTLSVSEVGYAVGFSSHSYFTQVFREEFGEAPLHFKENAR